MITARFRLGHRGHALVTSAPPADADFTGPRPPLNELDRRQFPAGISTGSVRLVHPAQTSPPSRPASRDPLHRPFAQAELAVERGTALGNPAAAPISSRTPCRRYRSRSLRPLVEPAPPRRPPAPLDQPLGTRSAKASTARAFAITSSPPRPSISVRPSPSLPGSGAMRHDLSPGARTRDQRGPRRRSDGWVLPPAVSGAVSDAGARDGF